MTGEWTCATILGGMMSDRGRRVVAVVAVVSLVAMPLAGVLFMVLS